MTRRHFASLLGSVAFAPLMPRSYDSVPEFTSGGIIRGRTLVPIGEHGPETIISLSGLDGRKLAEAIMPHIPDVVRRHGLA